MRAGGVPRPAARAVVAAGDAVAGASLLSRGCARRCAAWGSRRSIAVPLQVQEESIGLLVAYPGDRELSESDLALLTALAAQLAVAVQNARLHERATDLGNRLYDVLELEREASRRVHAFYEISRSFTQTLSLDTTLDAVTTTLVEQLGVDAAVIRVPDERGDQLVAHKVHVAESRLDAAVSTVLGRPQPLRAGRREPLLLDAAAARPPRRRPRAAASVPRRGLDGGAPADRRAPPSCWPS